MMKVTPCENWVHFKAGVVKKIGRLELPDMAQKQEEYVIALEVGPDVKKIKKNDKLIIVPADAVKHQRTDIDDADTMYGFIREENIIAKVEDEKE